MPYPAFFGITPELFRQQIEKLSHHGTFVSGTEIQDALKGKDLLPSRAIVITFDDGLREQYEEALPILDDMGIPAIFFVNTVNLEGKVSEVHKIHLLRSMIEPAVFLQYLKEFLQQHNVTGISLDDAERAGQAHYLYDNASNAALKYILNFLLPQPVLTALCDSLFSQYFNEKDIAAELYFTEKQLKQLIVRDMVGAHGHEHLPLGTLSEEHKKVQVQNPQEILSALVGRIKAIRAFSYPYGSEVACHNMHQILEENGYQFAFTMKRDINREGSSPYYFSRFDNNDMPGGKACRIPSGVNIFDYFIASNI